MEGFQTMLGQDFLQFLLIILLNSSLIGCLIDSEWPKTLPHIWTRPVEDGKFLHTGCHETWQPKTIHSDLVNSAFLDSLMAKCTAVLKIILWNFKPNLYAIYIIKDILKPNNLQFRRFHKEKYQWFNNLPLQKVRSYTEGKLILVDTDRFLWVSLEEKLFKGCFSNILKII